MLRGPRAGAGTGKKEAGAHGMDFGHVAIEMVTVSLPILLGWAVSKLGLMSERFERELSTLVLNVALPCLVLSSIFGNSQMPGPAETAQLMVGMLAFFVLAFIIACLMTALMRSPKEAKGVYRFIITFGNCGFIGFPVITAILGKQALVYAAVGLIPSNFFIFTVGIMLFSGMEGGWRKVAKSALACCKMPTLIASFIVLACMVTGFTDWGFVGDSIDIVGQMTTPAALLLMGASIAHYDSLSMLTNWRAYVAAAGRLLVVPIAGMFMLRAFGVAPYVVSVLVLESAMPVASNGTLYAIQYGADTKPMMQGTFISIVASILTIPLVTVLAAA